MANLTEEEAKIVAEVQAELRRVKRGLAMIDRRMTDLMEIQHEGGRLAAEAAAMEMRGLLRGASGMIDQGHSAGTRGLCDCYEDGGVVIMGGGGGR